MPSNKVDLQARAQAARQSECTFGGVRFTVVLPSAYRLQTLYRGLDHLETNLRWFDLQRHLVEASVIGWSGLTVADVSGDAVTPGGEEEVDFDAELVPILLDNNVEAMAAIAEHVIVQLGRRNAKSEALKKKLIAQLEWASGQDELRTMREVGLGGLIVEPDAPLPEVQAAVECWNWCGGWFPERVELFDRLYEVQDLDMTLELMLVMRDKGRGDVSQ